MEVKLQQQLAWVDQAPLYQIYLDLRKAYDALWLQSSFDVLINLFERIGLRTNAEKTKVMTCLPGKI